MLKQLSRLERTRSIIIVGFAVLMAISLVVFYAPGRNTTILDPSRNTTAVAKVNGEEITIAEVTRLKDNYLQRFGGQMSIAQLGGYKAFVNGLVRDRVVAQEAARLGLAASNTEISERIRKRYTDDTGKFVGMERYKQSAIASYGSVEAFERAISDEIAQEKLRAFVTASVKVSDEEVQEDYKRSNTTFDVSYAVLSAAKLAEKIQPSDDELKSYYDGHKEDFRINEPQKKVRYIFVDQVKSGEKIQISDKDLHQDFDNMTPENKQAGVKVQQILLKVARKDLDKQVEDKAKELIAKARAAKPEEGEKVFSDLAKGNSEDPATAKTGGYLPRPVSKNPTKVDALYDRTLDMQPGDVTDVPIKYGGQYYILRRGESVPKTFEEAKASLLASSRNRKGYAAASKIAERAAALLKETKDPQKVAQELAAEANMKPADMVKETPFIKPGDDVPNIGSSQQFEAVVAPLNNANDVGERTGVKGGFAIPMLIDKREPRVPEFEEIKTNVAQVVKQQRAKEQLEQKAKEIAASLTTAADLKATVEKAGFEALTEEAYKPGVPLGTAGTSPVLDEALYTLKSGEVSKTPVKMNDAFIVAGVTKRTEADLAEFAKQRERLTQSTLSTRQSQVYEDYITAVLQRMKQDGKIKIYTDVITSLEESEPEIAPAPRPQFPFPSK